MKKINFLINIFYFCYWINYDIFINNFIIKRLGILLIIENELDCIEKIVTIVNNQTYRR